MRKLGQLPFFLLGTGPGLNRGSPDSQSRSPLCTAYQTAAHVRATFHQEVLFHRTISTAPTIHSRLPRRNINQFLQLSSRKETFQGTVTTR